MIHETRGNNTELRGGAHARLINGPERDLALFREAFNKTRRRLCEYVCVEIETHVHRSTVRNVTMYCSARETSDCANATRCERAPWMFKFIADPSLFYSDTPAFVRLVTDSGNLRAECDRADVKVI